MWRFIDKWLSRHSFWMNCPFLNLDANEVNEVIEEANLLLPDLTSYFKEES